MQIKMTGTYDGSPDGCDVKTYEKGQTYDVPDRLGQVFVDAKQAKLVSGGKPGDVTDETASDEAPHILGPDEFKVTGPEETK